MKLGATMNIELQNVLAKLETLPGKLAFQAKKIKEVIKNELADLNKERLKLIELYANKGEDGKVKQGPNGELDFHPENVVQINKAYSDLQNIDITLPTQIKISDLPDSSPLNAKDLAVLDTHGILDQEGYVAPALTPKTIETPPPAVDPSLPLAAVAAPEAPVTPPADAPQNNTVDSDVAPATPETAPEAAPVDSTAVPAAPLADASLGPDPTPAAVAPATTPAASS